MSRKITFLVAVGAVMSLALGAIAAPSVDTLLTAGYDSDEMALVFSVTDTPDAEDGVDSLDCFIEPGEYTYTLEDTDTDTDTDTEGVLVETLKSKDKDEDVKFEWENTDLAEGDDGYVAPVVYGAEGFEPCALYAFYLEPNGNGEVNHGTVVSTFVHLMKDAGLKGAGCVNRYVAQTEWGREDAASLDTVDEAMTVMLESFEAACNKAKKDKDSVATTLDSEGEDVKGPAWKTTGDKPNKGKGNGKNK